MALTFSLSRNSIANCTIDCDDFNIHYAVSTPCDIFKQVSFSTMTRRDAETGEETVIAEWERVGFHCDRIRLPPSTQFEPMDMYLKKESWFSPNHCFFTSDGNQYTWEPDFGGLKLFVTSESARASPIASFSIEGKSFQDCKATLVVQSPAKDILDSLIVTFLVVEAARRDQKREEASLMRLRSRGAEVSGLQYPRKYNYA